MNHQELKPTIRIGKKGITPEIVKDIKRQIRQRTMIKIKFLKSFLHTVNKQEVFENLTKDTNTKLVHKVGGVVVLSRK